MPPNRSVSARDQQRIQAAIARGGIPSSHAAYWAAKAAAGDDISLLDLTGVLPSAAGPVAAAASQEDRDYEALFGGPREQDGNSLNEYRSLFGTRQEGEQAADAQAVAAKAAAAALTDDQVYERMFGKISVAPAPVAAAAAGPANQHGPGEAARKRYRVHAPYVTVRVPRGSNGVAAGAEPAATSWRVIELRGGDLVPEDARPEDVSRLRQQKNRLGPLIRPKLRVVWMPRPPLAWAFAPSLAAVSDYLRRVSGMAVPMSSKAWRCWLVGSVRTGTVAGVPAKRSSLRVRVPRWARSPRKLR